MIHPTQTLSRIARKPDRPAEAAAHTASLVAVVTTLLMVGTGQVAESNPVSAFVHATIGLEAWVVATPVLVGAALQLSEHLPWGRLRKATPRAIVAVCSLDAVGNLAIIATIGLPETLLLGSVATTVASTLVLAGAVYYRRELVDVATSVPRPSWETTRAVGMAIMLLTVAPFGFALVYTQPVDDGKHGSAAAASSGGLTYTASDDNTVKALNSTGATVWSYTGHSDTVNSVTLSPSGDKVITASSDQTVRALDADTGELLWTQSKYVSTVWSSTFSPDGDTIYTGESLFSGASNNGVRALNASTGDIIWNSSVISGDQNVQAIEAGPNGEYVFAGADNELVALDPKDGTLIWRNTTYTSASSIYGIDVSSDGKSVYSGASYNNVTATDAATGSDRWKTELSGTVHDVVLSPSEDTIFAGIGGTKVIGLKPSDGSQNYSYSGSGILKSFSLGGSGETFYIGENDGTVQSIDKGSKTQNWATVAHSNTVGSVSGGAEQKPTTSTGQTVKIRVTDQNGNPVANATVESYGVNTKKLDSTIDDLEARSNELLDQAANPRPNSWNPDLSISDSVAADAEGKYVTTHSAGDMGIAGWADSPELRPAQLDFERGETVYAYVWDPSDGGLVQDGVEDQYPGGVDDNTAVVVEQIDHKNDTISKTVYETDETYNVGGLGGEHDYVALNLPPGYYRIYAEGDPQNAVVREVGNPASIIERDLRNEAQKYSDQAQQVRDRISNGKFARQTLTTNESGYVTITPASGVEVIAIQAYKGDGSLVDAKNPDPSALRELRAGGFDGAIYLSTQPKRVNLNNFDTANDTAQVEVRKWTATPYGNVSRFQNLAEKLQNQLLNETTADLETAFEDRLEQVNRDNLEQRWADLANLLRSNPDARERYLNETNRDQIPAAEDLSDSELRKSLRVAQSALATQPSTGASGDTTTDVGDGVADFTAILNGEYEPDDIAIFAHYSNGTTRTVPDEYVSVDQSTIGSETEIQVNDYPVGQEDPAQITFEVKAANSEGVDSVRDSIVNPAFGGEVPNIEAVDVSTLRPGPTETVSVSLRPASDSSYGSLKDVRVFGPSGAELNATLDGERATFETNGQGTHTIRATYTDTTGAVFVETIRLNAQEATTNPPPTVRIEDGGDTVIAGSGLRSARVEETPDGKRVTAVVPGDGDRPGTVHVRGSDAFTGDVTVNVVQGDLEESVDKHVSVVVHTQLPEGALVYRDGRDQPITRDGSTQYGEVEERTGDDGSTKHIIRTYSDASGQLQLEVSRDPGFVERTLYDFRTSGVPLPSIGMLYNAVVIYDEAPTQPPAVVTETLEQPLLDEADPGEIVPGDAAAAMEVAA